MMGRRIIGVGIGRERLRAAMKEVLDVLVLVELGVWRWGWMGLGGFTLRCL